MAINRRGLPHLRVGKLSTEKGPRTCSLRKRGSTKKDRFPSKSLCPRCHHMVRREQLFGVACPICGWRRFHNTAQTGDALIDVFDDKEHIEIITMMPTACEDSIKIDVKDDVLLISIGDHHQTVSLLSAVEPDFEKTYNNGVLVIKLRKKLNVIHYVQ